MSSHYNNNTHFFFNIAIWLGISLGISLYRLFAITIPNVISCYNNNICYTQFLYEKETDAKNENEGKREV